ncbi:hypothetical protein E6P97_03155 [Patescibacteria group bacterium]|nr:MAG: hypothetical protein E6P97_03155 [Patescibacteria group bacterium]
MAINGQLSSESSVDTVHGTEFKALQAILIAQGEPMSYHEVTEIGHELLDFFEALSQESTQAEVGDA